MQPELGAGTEVVALRWAGEISFLHSQRKRRGTHAKNLAAEARVQLTGELVGFERGEVAAEEHLRAKSISSRLPSFLKLGKTHHRQQQRRRRGRSPAPVSSSSASLDSQRERREENSLEARPMHRRRLCLMHSRPEKLHVLHHSSASHASVASEVLPGGLFG